MKKVLLVIAVITIGVTSCYKDNADDMYPTVNNSTCDTTNVTFSAVIKPIIDAKCATAGCHIGTAATGYDFTSWAGVEAVAMHDKLLPAINHTGPNPMPEGQAKLDDCTIAKITKWVNDGAKNN
jgi:hypothetical protein